MSDRPLPSGEGGPLLVGRRAYLVAVAAMAVGLVLVKVLLPLTDEVHLAPLVGVTALLALTCGTGPALCAVAFGWGVALLLVMEPRWRVEFGDSADVMRWLLPLGVAVLIVVVSHRLRQSGSLAIRRASLAEETSDIDRRLQQLASALSAAAKPAEVAHALLSELPGLIGSRSGSLGLVEHDELVIVDPEGAARPALEPGLRLPLTTRAPITVAARTGTTAFAVDRRSFVREFPDGAVLAPYASGALAVPLRAEGHVVGSMGFPFVNSGEVDGRARGLAELAASLGGQALERSLLYERERAMREGLERIARMAPRFSGESVDAVVSAVCAEARETFGADTAQVWTLTERGMEVMCRDPAHEEFPPGTTIDLSEFPGLGEVIERLEPVFERDVLEHASGEARRRVLRADSRSVLRVPIVVRGTPDRVLSLIWSRVVTEPTAEQLALARRFGDHAGLALEQAERRRAEREAARSAVETRRLLAATAALAAATTSEQVAGAALDELSRSLGSSAASLVRLSGDVLELVAATGLTEAELAPWRRFELSAPVPLCRAISTNEIVAIPSKDSLARSYPGVGDTRSEAWVAVPVTAAGRPVGGIGLSFAEPRQLTPTELDYVSAVAEQAGQALERVVLAETELAARETAEQVASERIELHEREHAARVAAELAAGRTRLLQAVAERLAAAATAADVAEVVVAQVVEALAADAATVYAFDADRDEARLLASLGLPAGTADSWRVIAVDTPTPVIDVVLTGRPVALETEAQIAERHPYAGAEVEVRSSYCYPLEAGGRVLGVVCFDYRTPTVLDGQSVDLARTVFRQGAIALDRSLRFEEEFVSRRRSERLQRLTAKLSGALTAAEVAAAFLDDGLAAVGADAALLAVSDEESGELRPLGWRGFGDQEADELIGALGEDRHSLARPSYSTATRPSGPEPGATELPSGHRAHALLPLAAGRGRLGVMVLAWSDPVRLVARDRAFLETVVGQCGLALDRAQRYENERVIAETLQRSILPETLPSMDGVRVAARYLPGTSALDVGGDWFDTLTLPDGLLGFSVGDVVGKGVQAASTMAQLRNGMRALTLEDISVAETVGKVNALLDGYTDAPFATLVYLTLDPATGEARFVSAGHLPPLVVTPEREVHLLEGGGGLPLGVDADIAYEESHTRLEPGSTIVLYTDGLVERRTRSLDDGIAQLVDAARRAPSDPDALVDWVVGELLGDEPRGDDVALLAVRLETQRLRDLELELPAEHTSLRSLRDELRTWLRRAGVPERDAQDVLLAAWEAAANAVEHAGGGETATVSLHASRADDHVRIEVRDSGAWRSPHEREDRGFGLRLIEGLMAPVDVSSGEHGTTVVMQRSLAPQTVTDAH